MDPDSHRPKTILIVDDIASNRLVLQDYMTTLGYTSVLAENGRAALVRIAQQPVDLILLDILMPVIDGYTVLDHLKADEDWRDLPVIIISAVEEQASVMRCLERGADDYLLKPFNRDLLKPRITACLEKKEYRDRDRRIHAELVASYEALRKAEQTRDALVHMIVHDLNNPLTVVAGYVELLKSIDQDDTIDRSMVARSVRSIHEATEEMSLLIKGILDVSKLEDGQMPVDLKAHNAVHLAQSVYERMAIEADRQQIKFSFNVGEEDIPVLADDILLSRVLQNLIVNAFKFVGRDAQVALSVTREGRVIRFTVEDNGPGISTEDQGRIFDKFYQVAARQEGKKLGVGLGLAFCQLAVEAQGGRIRVYSMEGQGTRFHVELPVPADA